MKGNFKGNFVPEKIKGKTMNLEKEGKDVMRGYNEKIMRNKEEEEEEEGE